MALARNMDAATPVLADLAWDRIAFPLAVVACLLLASWIAAALGVGPMPFR